MIITTTKKLKGVLEIVSLGVQMTYKHPEGKPQTRMLENKHYSNSDLQAAVSMGYITISDVKPEVSEDDDNFETAPEITVKLINKTSNPIVLSAPKIVDCKELPAKGFLVLPISVLSSPALTAIIASGKVEVQDLANTEVTKYEKALTVDPENSPLDLDDIEDEEDEDEALEEEEEEVEVAEVPKNDTTAVVANPNNETMYKTDQSLKKVVNASKPKKAKKEKDSKMKVYSPNDKSEKKKKTSTDDDEISFVDKEQDEKRIETLSVGDVSDTEAIRVDKFEDTTATVIQRKAKKASKKSSSKKNKPSSGKQTVLDI